ncbi:MAG: DUF4367 domain-containing protein [Caldilineaceae bacterium]
MTQDSEQTMEQLLIQNVGQVRYPPTPEIAQSVRHRLQRRTLSTNVVVSRLGWIVVVLVIVLASLFSVPPLRAAILDFLRIGAVQIGPPEADFAPTSAASTQLPTITPKRTLLPLSGETTLTEAHKRIPWPIKLPTYPPDLGEPDAVYVQSLDGDALILVWMDKDNSSQVRLSLHMLQSDVLVWKKVTIKVVQQTTVNQHRAYWTTGPYLLEIKGKGIHETRLIDGHVLIWEEAGITYRLECNLTLEEAVKVAESLH